MRTAGDGPGLVSNQKVRQTFLINDKSYFHEFLVVDTLNLPGVHILIGFDLIRKLKLTIHAGSQTKVVLDQQLVPVIPCLDSINVNVINIADLKPLKLYTENDVNIPACTSINVCTVIKKEKVDRGQVLFLYPESKYTDYCPAEAVSCVHDENNVYFSLYNFTPVSQFIPQGTLIAFAERVSLPSQSIVSPVTVTSTNTPDSINALDQSFETIIRSNTPATLVNGVLDIAKLYRHQFVVENEPTGYTDHLPFEINTGNARPIAQRPYRLPVAYEKEVNDQLAAMQRDNIISLSKSPWSSPLVVVKKKDASLRLCVDYRRLNSITEGDSFPLPSIEELLLKVRNSKYFSTLDLKAGYHQVAVAPADRPKTAFSIGDKLFQFNTLPFGLKNAPSHFSRLMSSILANVIGTAVLIYLDDIVILGQTVEEHAANLIKVLEILKRYNLKCSLRKCKFFQTQVEFLGHIISSDGIQPVHDKVQSMRGFPKPKNAKEVNSFLGLCSYYRKFIRNFAEISRPLDRLRKTDNYEWSEDCQIAFDKLRSILSSDDMLIYPRFDRPFLVTCDASSVAIGGVVSQLDNDGNERPVSYCSRALKGAEINYSATDREALAIKYTLERHRYFLLGHEIKIKSDHQPLRYLFLKSDLSSRHARWLDSLMEFQISEFAYIKGRANRVADALSRAVETGGEGRGEKKRETPVVLALTRAQARAEAQSASRNSSLNDQRTRSTSWQSGSDHPPLDNDPGTDCNSSRANVRVNDGIPIVEWDVLQLIQSQNRDPIWSKVKLYVKNNLLQFPAEVRIPKERFLVEEDVLYVLSDDSNGAQTRIRTVLTPEFARLALELVHCCPISGHLGVAKTLKRAKSNFYWFGMDRQIKQFVEKCSMCIKFKGHRVAVPPARQWPIAQEKFFRVHMDLIGPLPMSQCGNRFICVITDALTRYTFSDVLPDKRALTVAKSFVKFINIFGCPRQLISDQGGEFTNQLLAEVNKMYGIAHNAVTAYRPSANGLVESKNKQIMSILRMLVADSPLDWPNKLQTATTALNTAYNRAIDDNPHFLVYGQDIRYPFDTFLNESKKPFYNLESYRDYLMETNHRVFKLVKHMLKQSSETNKHTYNIRFRTRESGLKAGDRVFVKRMQPNSKLESKFVGPYRVVEVNPDKVVVKNLHNSKISTVHLSHVLVVPERDVENVTNNAVTPLIYPDVPYDIQ